MNRIKFLKTTGLLVAGGIMGGAKESGNYFSGEALNEAKLPRTFDFPITDLHVHQSDKQSIEDIVAKSKETGIQFGVMENIAPWGIRNDEQLKAYIDTLKPYPVYIGLQPMSPGWSKNFPPRIDCTSRLRFHGSPGSS